jgi:hypothetical protein
VSENSIGKPQFWLFSVLRRGRVGELRGNEILSAPNQGSNFAFANQMVLVRV